MLVTSFEQNPYFVFWKSYIKYYRNIIQSYKKKKKGALLGYILFVLALMR